MHVRVSIYILNKSLAEKSVRISKDGSIKFRSKDSSDTVLYLLRNLMEQTLEVTGKSETVC